MSQGVGCPLYLLGQPVSHRTRCSPAPRFSFLPVNGDNTPVPESFLGLKNRTAWKRGTEWMFYGLKIIYYFNLHFLLSFRVSYCKLSKKELAWLQMWGRWKAEAELVLVPGSLVQALQGFENLCICPATEPSGSLEEGPSAREPSIEITFHYTRNILYLKQWNYGIKHVSRRE